MVGDDSGSRMYWELVDPGLVETASVGHYEYLGVGMFFSWISSTPEAAHEVYAKVREIHTTTEKSGFTAEELSQAKNKVKARVVLGGERPRNRLFNLGGNWLQRGEYRSVADDLASLDAVTLEEVHRVLAAYPLSQNTTVTIGPLEDWKAAI